LRLLATKLVGLVEKTRIAGTLRLHEPLVEPLDRGIGARQHDALLGHDDAEQGGSL
jgi:hypothetical protein